MSVTDLIKQAAPFSKFQMLMECVVGARTVKAKKKTGEAQHTRVEFCTQMMTPNDLMGIRKTTHVGIIVWIPVEKYNELAHD